MNFEELYSAVARLDDTVQELAPVIVPMLKQYEQEIVRPIEKNVTELIRQGQFDAATKLAKRAIAQDVKLEWTGSAKPPAE